MKKKYEYFFQFESSRVQLNSCSYSKLISINYFKGTKQKIYSIVRLVLYIGSVELTKFK